MKQFLTRTKLTLGQITAVAYVFILLKQFYLPNVPLLTISFHVFTTTALVLLFSPSKQEDKLGVWTLIFDLIGYMVCAFLVAYYWMNIDRIQVRFDMIDPVLIGERIAFWVGIPLILEGVRRTTGWSLVLVVLGFIVYGSGYVNLPGFFNFSGFKVSEFIEITMLGTDGVFGVASDAMVNLVFYFILFGVIFSITGGGEVFIDLSLKLFGKFKGGAAKVAVFSSSLFGMVSGSAVANVTTTGVMTIPLMKRMGYSPEEAAAIEAVASTGGQLVPPIMGVGAFVMAELLGIPYSRIAISGIIPAIAFYISLFLSVDLLANKKNLALLDYEIIKQKSKMLKTKIHLLLGPITIIFFIFRGYSVPYSALFGSIIAILIPLARRNTWYPLKTIYLIVIDTARQMAKISVSVSAIGVIIAVAIQSGIALRFVIVLKNIGGHNLIISLFLAVLGCLVLGLGLPTLAAYVIAQVAFVPALTSLGVQPIAAHFFIFYYSVLAMITPPVCLASYTAAGIANANSNKTGYLGFTLALSSFFLPFGFVLNIALLGYGTILKILTSTFGIICSACSWSIALQGYLGRRLNLFTRALFVIDSIGIIFYPPLSLFWCLSVICFLILIIYYYFINFNAKNNPWKKMGKKILG